LWGEKGNNGDVDQVHLSGPLFMAGASLLVGLRGSRLHAAIVQVNYSEFTLIWPIYVIVGKLKKTYLVMEKVN